MDQDYSVTSNLNTDYVFDGTYGPIPDENGFVDLTDYAKKYIADYKTVTEIPAENMEYLNHCTPNNMTRTFAGLVKVPTIDVSGMDTSHVSSFSYCFDGSASDTKSDPSVLSEIVGLNNLDFSSAIDVSYMFSYISNMKHLDLSNIKLTSLKNLNYLIMFSAFETLDLTNVDLSKIENMDYAFAHTSDTSSHTSTGNLNKIYGIEDFNTSNCNSMKGMFCNQYPITNTTLDLSKWDVSKVTNMSYMFCGNINVSTRKTYLNISGWNTSSVSNFKMMFYYYALLDINEVFDLSSISELDNLHGMLGIYENSEFTVHFKNVKRSLFTDISEFYNTIHSNDLGDSAFMANHVFIDNYID